MLLNSFLQAKKRYLQRKVHSVALWNEHRRVTFNTHGRYYYYVIIIIIIITIILLPLLFLMVSKRSHRFYLCLSFASVKVGGREICKMFSFFVVATVFGFQLSCFHWACVLVIVPCVKRHDTQFCSLQMVYNYYLWYNITVLPTDCQA